MTVAEFIARAYLSGQGKTDTLSPTDAKYIKLLALGNKYKNAWFNEPGVDWNSTYDPAIDCGTIAASDEITLDSSVTKVSQDVDDPVRVLHTDGVTVSEYSLVSPDKLKLYEVTHKVCAKVGNKLKFPQAFTTDSAEYGGAVSVPGYSLPADMSNPAGTVPVDDPEWLAVRVAAEDIRTDLVRQNQYPNLIAEANELMKKMKQNNNPQIETLTMRPSAYARTF